MKKIPLIRPKIPLLWPAVKLFVQKRIKNDYQFSNFGQIENNLRKKYNRLIFTSSGHDALRLAIKLKFQKNSTIGISNFTHSSTALAALEENMNIKILSTTQNGLIKKSELLEKLDGVIFTNPFGFGETNHLTFEGEMLLDWAGSFGSFHRMDQLTAFSFHATKALPIGEGGALFVPTEYDREEVIRLTNFGTLSNRLTGLNLKGTNCKITEFQAAQIETVLNQKQKRIKKIKSVIKNYLQSIKNISIVGSNENWDFSSPSLPVFYFLNQEITEKRFQKYIENMNDYDIEVKQYYIPLSYSKDFKKFCTEDCLNSKPTLAFALPRDVSEEEQKRIILCHKILSKDL